ncbi:hypothetical protein WJX74_003679 [Apatococcus lobatus]|uniref:Uncharacterized protein n=1 Tax=Apatococcus lobatus TaxID=904363 RepID=A0AAW1QZW6_9CHLO
MDHESRSVANSQRDRCFRKHHGWVRAKRCGFCERLSHVDEVGVMAPPWRVRLRRGDTGGGHSCLTWYCCTQCAQHLDTSQTGWRHRAPYIAPPSAVVPDLDPAWMHPQRQPPRTGPAKARRQHQPEVEDRRRSAQTREPAGGQPDPDVRAFTEGMKPGQSWADDEPGEAEIKFGSF